MSKGHTRYKIYNQNACYYLTFSTVEWIDVFTNKKFRDVLISSLRYCIKEKGLELYAFVIMSNHIHLICRAEKGFKLSDILRDFKKFTTKRIVELLQTESESRKYWLLEQMLRAGSRNSKKQTYQLWRNDNHPIELYSQNVIIQKLEYIHNNPVESGIVESPQQYIYSSAKEYYTDKKGLLDIEIISYLQKLF